MARSIVSLVVREVAKWIGHRTTARRLQKEASVRPESELVDTPSGQFWMSPIEARLYRAMCHEGLSPTPQFCIKGYHVDFAFPDIGLAIEADGSAYHNGERRDRDRKRDWILSRAGWTVKRFYGSTIHSRASNCAYVIRKEVESRRADSGR
jgi:very-short-patch-repair endonuclease